MLLMIHKPRPTVAERGADALKRAVRAVPAALDAVLAWPFRALENRRLLHAMAAMSDHDLADIGLSRGDVRDAMALPASGDAGRFLDGRRGARRARR